MEIYLSKFAERISKEEFNKKEGNNFYYFSLSKEITKTKHIGEIVKPTKIQKDFYYRIDKNKTIELVVKRLLTIYKTKRNEEVNNLIIELNDIPFNADEISQLRISRAIQILVKISLLCH